jgi:hypothetical protein
MYDQLGTSHKSEKHFKFFVLYQVILNIARKQFWELCVVHRTSSSYVVTVRMRREGESNRKSASLETGWIITGVAIMHFVGISRTWLQ